MDGVSCDRSDAAGPPALRAGAVRVEPAEHVAAQRGRLPARLGVAQGRADGGRGGVHCVPRRGTRRPLRWPHGRLALLLLARHGRWWPRRIVLRLRLRRRHLRVLLAWCRCGRCGRRHGRWGHCRRRPHRAPSPLRCGTPPRGPPRYPASTRESGVLYCLMKRSCSLVQGFHAPDGGSSKPSRQLWWADCGSPLRTPMAPRGRRRATSPCTGPFRQCARPVLSCAVG